MKVRNSFVSNSSSSSFVLGFVKKPKSQKELMDLMFPNFNPNELIDAIESYLTYGAAVKIVFKDLKKARVMSKLKIGEFLYRSGDFYNGKIMDECIKESRDFATERGGEFIFPKFLNFTDEEIYHDLYMQGLNKYHKEEKKAIKEYWETEQHKFDNLKTYMLEYDDHLYDGILEQGDIFFNIPYIKINNH